MNACRLALLILAVGEVATARAQTSGQSGPSPQVTVTAPRDEQALPNLKEDEFVNCMGMVGAGTIDYTQASLCNLQLSREEHAVVDACVNSKGESPPARVVQACTEALDHNIFEGSSRYFLVASRAAGYSAEGDKQHALDDYDEALKLAPSNAYVYYNRGLFYATQTDYDAALRDLDAAIRINAKLVAALHLRARIYHNRGNFTAALADYSQAIGVEPKTAALWSERGYVSIRQKDYEGAVRDEEQAIHLDPKLARAYYLRGAAAAYGGLTARNPIEDVKIAVGLDDSLARYVTIKDKTVSLGLPPL